ncbi:unnamed protein product [Peniophora sp. CBMAI 1063]|nr:unnamed protein product [Peniophora sp. CBMAI 1063]
MPAIPTSTRSSSAPTGLFSPVFLYALLAVLIVFVIILITVSNYRAMSRRKANASWTAGPAPTLSTRPQSVSQFKPFLLRADLALPPNAQLRRSAEKEFTVVRGKRMSRPISFSFEEPVQPPLPVYTSAPPSLAPKLHISLPKAAPAAEIGLDTPPPTPIVAEQPVDDICKHEEASSPYSMPSQDSVSSLFRDSSVSFSSLLDAFPSPPTTTNTAKPTRVFEDIYPTPPTTPLIPIFEFTELPASNASTALGHAPPAPISPSRPMRASDSDILILDRLFIQSHPSSPSMETIAFEEPQCPPHQTFAAYKAPLFTVTPIPASASFRATVEFASAGGYLTPPASSLWF